MITRQVSEEHLLSTTRGSRRRAGGARGSRLFCPRGKAIGFVRDLALFFHAVIEVASRGERGEKRKRERERESRGRAQEEKKGRQMQKRGRRRGYQIALGLTGRAQYNENRGERGWGRQAKRERKSKRSTGRGAE